MLLFSLVASAQDQKKIDSLKQVLKSAHTDKVRTKACIKLCIEFQGFNTDSCIYYGNKTIESAKKSNEPIEIAAAYNNIGKSYDHFGNNEKALANFLLSIKEGEKDKTGVGMMVCAVNYQDIANKYDGLNDIKSAFEFRKKGLSLVRKVKNNQRLINEAREKFSEPEFMKEIEASLSISLGQSYRSLNNSDSAIYCFELSVNLFDEIGMTDGKMISISNIADIYKAKKEYDKALKNYQMILDYGRKNKGYEFVFISGPLTSMAEMYIEQGKYDKSIESLNEALSYIRTNTHPSYIQICYDLLARAYRKKKDFEKAFLYKDSLYTIKDSIAKTQNDKNTTEMKVKFSTSEKEKQLKLSEQETELIKLESDKQKTYTYAFAGGLILVLLLSLALWRNANNKRKAEKLLGEKQQITAMLEGQEAERRRIASDLHDRLGSMLATVKLYFNSVEGNINQLKQENKEQYEKANSLLDEACDEVRKISHDLASDVLVKMGLVPALNELKENISKSKQINMNVFAYGLKERLSPETEVALYRIVQELTGNALKHSKAKNLTVQLNKIENNLNLMVEDDGIGFNSELALKKEGMGLKNLQERVNKLNGKFNIDSHEGKGATIIIDIIV